MIEHNRYHATLALLASLECPRDRILALRAVSAILGASRALGVRV